MAGSLGDLNILQANHQYIHNHSPSALPYLESPPTVFHLETLTP